jgi:phosphoribosylformylglycinamidine cyclo-ligase
MVVVVDASAAAACAATLTAAGEADYTIGRITAKGDTAAVVVA